MRYKKRYKKRYKMRYEKHYIKHYKKRYKLRYKMRYKKRYKRVTKCVTKSVTKCVTKSDTKNVTKCVTESVTKCVTKSDTKSATKIVTKCVTKVWSFDLSNPFYFQVCWKVRCALTKNLLKSCQKLPYGFKIRLEMGWGSNNFKITICTWEFKYLVPNLRVIDQCFEQNRMPTAGAHQPTFFFPSGFSECPTPASAEGASYTLVY